MRAHSGSPARWLAGLGLVLAMWWVAFEQGDRIPLLTYVNLGVHELGHMLTYSWSELNTMLAGSVLQVAVPILVAAYFFFRRDDWVAAGVCLVWAATSAIEVAIYVADAPVQQLDLIGGRHDWAYILGPDGYAAMDQADSIATQIRDGAWIATVLGFVLCLAAPLRGRRAQEEATEPASRATAPSRP
ncbi:MAG TPA: hypothetical protein VD790_03955 [Thermoleophilaceae bacterium]|nr:hypothetical protein [Thermoleophilaceae bacterium]